MATSFIQSLTLQPAHGYCVLASLVAFPVNIYGIHKVVTARKLFGIKYPILYADKEHKHATAFNCVQRGHQNFLENLPLHLMLSLFASVYRPEVAAIAILVRNLGFAAYIRGYATGNAKNRRQGMFGYAGLLVMIGLSVEFAVRLASSSN